MGYSIRKVADMLASDHLHGVSDEMKRASVLMALDAAGISVDEVLRDAAMRQSAINCYESDQWEHFEEYWAAKAAENSHTQSELERITAQYPRTHQTQSRRNRAREGDFCDVANHEAAGSPAHRRSRGNLLEAVPRRNFRRAATRAARSSRHRQAGLTQIRPRAVVIRNVHHHSSVRARHAVPDRPNSTRVPATKTQLTHGLCDTRTHCVDYRTRLIPPRTSHFRSTPD